MTDIELLIRAARAIGATDYTGPDDCSPPGIKFLNGTPTNYEGRGEWGYEWIPLKNDDEALRLAMTLNIDVQFNTDDDEQTTSAIAPSPENPGSGEGWSFTEGWCEDKASATRRAIVRAAAALADSMP